jgi:hypothetical protein
MGWTSRVPSQNRIEDIIFNRVVGEFPTKDSKGSLKIQNIKKDKLESSLPEFRTLILLSLRKMDTSKPTSFEKALSTAPMEWKNSKVVDRFAEPKIIPRVDLVQQSYAFKSSLMDPKSKTTLVHYSNARNRLIASTANEPLIDSEGKTFESPFELPEPVLEQFRKRFSYPAKKRKAEDSPMQDVSSSVQVTPIESLGIGASQRLAPPVRPPKPLTRSRETKKVKK